MRTLRISLSLKNAYRVNGILYSLKQVPLLKKLLPDSLYQEDGLKILANIISVLWEIVTAFAGKFIYILFMVFGASRLYDRVPHEDLFLHILLFLTLIGIFANTYMFNPSKDKYYAIILMRMNAKEYTLGNYGYAIVKVIIGFLPFVLIFGHLASVPLWICLLIPFYIAGTKVLYASNSLRLYKKYGTETNENNLGKYRWILMFLLLALAYGLPAVGFCVPQMVCAGVMLLGAAAGVVSVRRILGFGQYREMYQEILIQSMNQMDEAKKSVQNQSRKTISADMGITSDKSGFEYLNELFVRRHQKILWKSAKRTAGVCLFCVLAVFLLFYLMPESKEVVNKLLLSFLPYFVFLMYVINRGTGFTRALFMNCDHSLLTYSFYKQPKFVLKLFRIRLWEIMKINLLPAAVIGGGLTSMLFLSGGTENPLNYLVLLVSILCMSMFFSVHYLTIYYLLQPYNAETEVKSAVYQIVIWVTYFMCYMMLKLQMPTLIFGGMTIVFCVLYCVVACVLVYRVAPKTFRLRA